MDEQWRRYVLAMDVRMDGLTNAPKMGAETDVIKQASRLIESGKRIEALALLEQAVALQPQSRLLLQAAGRLYLQQGEPVRAAAYLERALAVNNTPEIDSYDQQAVVDTDFDYLDEQEQDLAECDYTIPGVESEPQITPLPKPKPRQTLTLSGRREKKRASDKTTARVRYKSSSDSGGGTDDKPTSSADLRNTVTKTQDLPPTYTEQATSHVVSKAVKPEPVPPSDESEGLPENAVVLGGSRDIEQGVLDDAPVAIPELQTGFEDDFDGDVQSTWTSEAELDSEYLPPVGIAQGLYDEPFVDFAEFDSEEGDEPDDDCFSDSATSDELLVFAPDNAFDTDDYGLWDDMQAGAVEVKEEEAIPQGAADGVSRAERARQKAVEVILRVGWEFEELDFLTQVFIENGWGAARKAIEREIQVGTTFEQLELAREIRLVWRESDRYWITFGKLNPFAQITDAAYKNLSWSQALRIIRVFQYIPCADELESFLDDEFEFWYSNKILRLRYPAFIKYLNYYRINSDYPYLSADEFRCFDVPVSYDALSSSEFMHTHSDAVVALRTYGIDLFADYSPKNYYATDEPFNLSKFDKKSDYSLMDEKEQGSD